MDRFDIPICIFIFKRMKAVEIIKRIEKDFSEVAEEYDFYACSDGLAQRPDFIRASKKENN